MNGEVLYEQNAHDVDGQTYKERSSWALVDQAKLSLPGLHQEGRTPPHCEELLVGGAWASAGWAVSESRTVSRDSKGVSMGFWWAREDCQKLTTPQTY